MEQKAEISTVTESMMKSPTTTTQIDTETPKQETSTLAVAAEAEIDTRHLPYDVLMKIAAQVSTKTVMKLRLVSKSWCSIIDSPTFRSLHFASSPINQSQSHLIFAHRSRFGFICPVDEPLDETLTIPIAPAECVFCIVRGYVNGIMLCVLRCVGDVMRVVLTNPSIRKWREIELPVVDGWKTGVFNTEFFLGFEEEKEDYRVLRLSRAGPENLIQVYSLKDQTWRRIEAGGYVPFCNGDQIFVKGVIHWFGLNEDDQYEVITFNVKEEKFGTLECPFGIDFGGCVFGYNGTIGVFNGRLDGLTTSVWVMAEYGVQNSWMMLCTFNVPSRRFVHLGKEGELMFSKDMELSSYNTNTQVLKLDLKKKRGKYTATYVENLELMNDPDGKESKSLKF